jgi:hypothetical protein
MCECLYTFLRTALCGNMKAASKPFLSGTILVKRAQLTLDTEREPVPNLCADTLHTCRARCNRLVFPALASPSPTAYHSV